MQILSLAQPWGGIQGKGYVVHNNGNYKFKTEVGFDSQWTSSLRSKDKALLASAKRSALGYGSGIFAGDNEGSFSFRQFSLAKRCDQNKVGVVMAADKAKDYYSILSVYKTASNQDVRAACQKLYRQYGDSGSDGAHEDGTTGSPGVTPIDLFDSLSPGSPAQNKRLNDMAGTPKRFQNGDDEQDDNPSFVEHRLVEELTHSHGFGKPLPIHLKDQSAKQKQDNKLSTESEIAADEENGVFRKFFRKFRRWLSNKDKTGRESNGTKKEENEDPNFWGGLDDQRG